jgi:hypothetical protein
MGKKKILIKEIAGERLEVIDGDHTQILKKSYDESGYCRKVDEFFTQHPLDHLSSEEKNLARGYLAWSYFWTLVIYEELFQQYPIENYEYVTDNQSRLGRYLIWLQEKPVWTIWHWGVYLCVYLPMLKLRLKFNRLQILVGFTIDDSRWDSYTAKKTLLLGGGNWLHASWLYSFPILHPRVHALKGPILERVLAHVKNMKASHGYLKWAISGTKQTMCFWDDYNFTYPLRLAARELGLTPKVFQHAPSITPIHVTGQVLRSSVCSDDEIWSCWDLDWQALCLKLNPHLKFDSGKPFVPSLGPVRFNPRGVVVFPWEAFCDNSLKINLIQRAVELGLPVAVKFRAGVDSELSRKSFGLPESDSIHYVQDWSELTAGVRCVVGGQTALLYQCYKSEIPVVILEHLSGTYSAWLDQKRSLDGITRCRSDEQVFQALQALV